MIEVLLRFVCGRFNVGAYRYFILDPFNCPSNYCMLIIENRKKDIEKYEVRERGHVGSFISIHTVDIISEHTSLILKIHLSIRMNNEN